MPTHPDHRLPRGEASAEFRSGLLVRRFPYLLICATREAEDNEFMSRQARHISDAAKLNNLVAGFMTHGKYAQAEP